MDDTSAPFETLGVHPDATREEIRAAYLRLVQIYHPDRFGDSREDVRLEAQARLAQVNVAFEQIQRHHPPRIRTSPQEHAPGPPSPFASAKTGCASTITVLTNGPMRTQLLIDASLHDLQTIGLSVLKKVGHVKGTWLESSPPWIEGRTPWRVAPLNLYFTSEHTKAPYVTPRLERSELPIAPVRVTVESFAVGTRKRLITELMNEVNR